MKIKTDKKLISIAQQETVKIAVADFKHHFCEDDLIREYAEAFDVDVYGKVIECDIVAFMVADDGDNCSFMIDLTVRNSLSFTTLHFYIDCLDGEYSVCKAPNLHEMVKYEMKK